MIDFYKYQGTGNDFVLIDNRSLTFEKNEALVAHLCDRRFGIGADGLILLENELGFDFKMVYYNSDGKLSSMCGNGGRCISNFAKQLGIVQDKAHFLAVDGPHEALLLEADWVELKMGNVDEIEEGDGFYILDTGSPHYVIFVEDIDDINVVENGQAIRYSNRFKEKGINVNFVERNADGIIVATYERGVEDETLSCGTGVTAAALAYRLKSGNELLKSVNIEAKGGSLKVKFSAKRDGGFKDIWLCGKAELVFEGKITQAMKKLV